METVLIDRSLYLRHFIDKKTPMGLTGTMGDTYVNEQCTLHKFSVSIFVWNILLEFFLSLISLIELYDIQRQEDLQVLLYHMSA